jgi:NAD(P)-dependent dehydrogenase (short-subunit alcohol dehydrogenase family)
MSNKRIALITGANKGIGLETARQLGKEGITVLVGARDEKKSKGAAEERGQGGGSGFIIASRVGQRFNRKNLTSKCARPIRPPQKPFVSPGAK